MQVSPFILPDYVIALMYCVCLLRASLHMPFQSFILQGPKINGL